MFSVFWHTIRDRKWSFLSFFGSGLVFSWMFVSLYPTVQKTQVAVSELVKSLPEAFNKAFALDPKSFTTFEGFIAGKHFSILWPVLAIMIVASLAGSVISGEIEKGTIDLELSLPISRTKLYLSKIFAGIFGLSLFVIFSVLSIIPLAELYDIPYTAVNFVTLSMVGFLFGLAVLSLSMFASSIFSEKGKALFAVIGVLLVMYVSNIIALLNESLDKLKYVSFFHHFDYSGILLENKVSGTAPWIFMVTFLLFGAAGMFWFSRRDIAI